MAIFNSVQLAVDTKAQDRLREWFAKRGLPENVVITCVGLGDSDVDYNMTQQATRIKVIQAPYQVPRIKHHLYYSGVTANITGTITTFIRRVNELDQIESLYNYPPNNITYTAGIIPPTLANGYNFATVDFNTLNPDKEGFIVYFQTLPDGYLDSSGVQQRLVEQYDFTFNNIPVSWEVILDQINGSFLIAKPAGYVFSSLQGSIVIKGLSSSLTKTILFNY
jgi:hypothetical protein